MNASTSAAANYEKPALIKDLEKRTKNVQGVREVENLLHVPGSKAPTAT